MNAKTYLVANSSPLLDNPKNILILGWLEGNSFCTLTEISTRTNISLKEISEIILILYKNNLVAYNKDQYEITIDGIKLLDKLGLSDLQITTLLDQTDFQPEEYSIYKSIFHEWRSNFLSIYLFIFDTIENKYNNICMPFSSILSSSKMGNSLLIASLLHKFAQILYMEENSLLMKHYNRLYEYSFLNHCVSSEIYHYTSEFWKPNNNRIKLYHNFEKSLELFLQQTFQSLCDMPFESKKGIKYTKLHGAYDLTTLKLGDLNYDLLLCNDIVKNNEILSKIFACENLNELSQEFNWTQYQAKFILKSIRTKIDNLLQTNKTNATII